MPKRRFNLLLLAFLTFLSFSFFGVPKVQAQDQEKGFTFYEEYRGSLNTFGQTTVLDLSGGYNFDKHFGVDLGLPLSFVHRSNNNIPAGFAPNSWNSDPGDAYLNLRFNEPNPVLNYNSQARIFAPTGSYPNGFSTGRVTVDFNNHVDRAFGRFTPFGEASLGDTVGDRHYFVRPFRTLGFVSMLEGGSDIKLTSNIYGGGSWYGVEPGSTQHIFSQLVPESMGFVPKPITDSRFFTSQFRTIGPRFITKDDGLSGWLGFKTGHNVDLEVDYSHSTHYDLNSLSFRVGFNAGALVKRIASGS